jgi:hypothetical protein
MNALRTSLRPLLALLVVVLASCAKEEPVAPCGHESAPAVLRMEGGPSGGSLQAAAPGRLPGATDRDDIGDDGDDLSGTEKPRKPRNY